MATRKITSSDWHLEGVSVKTRRFVAAYAKLRNIYQGQAVEELIQIASSHIPPLL